MFVHKFEMEYPNNQKCLHIFQFFYLSQGESHEIEGVDDLKDFSVTKQALGMAGFSEQVLEIVWCIFANFLLRFLISEPGWLI